MQALLASIQLYNGMRMPKVAILYPASNGLEVQCLTVSCTTCSSSL